MPRYKTPPHNLEAERSVIGSVFIDNDCLQHIDLSPVDFHATAHQIIWKAIMEVSAEKHPIDIITICNHLKKSNSLEAAGHVPGIAEIVDSVPTAANVSVYVKIMKDKAARRKLIEQLRNLATQAYDDEPMDNIIDEAQVTFRYIMEDLGGKKKSMPEEVREWVLSSSGIFSSSDFLKFHHVSSLEIKKNVSNIFGRLVDERVIERYGNKNGQFRKVDIDCEIIDFVNAAGTSVDIKWPLGIEDYVPLGPGNVACVAGCKNAGKTAWLLNLVKMNQDKFKIHYFSSEMGANEFKKRLLKFPDMKITDWKFVAKERSFNFHDVIVPGEGNINIIDYLEIVEDFWLVTKYIRDIWLKLDGAIAVIALQKDVGRSNARGGEGWKDKARLAISIEGGTVTIEKGKEWACTTNPDGLARDFWVVDGCSILAKNEWYYKEEKKEGIRKW